MLILLVWSSQSLWKEIVFHRSRTTIFLAPFIQWCEHLLLPSSWRGLGTPKKVWKWPCRRLWALPRSTAASTHWDSHRCCVEKWRDPRPQEQIRTLMDLSNVQWWMYLPWKKKTKKLILERFPHLSASTYTWKSFPSSSESLLLWKEVVKQIKKGNIESVTDHTFFFLIHDLLM